MPEVGVSIPIDFMVLSNNSLSSALSIASLDAPISSTPYFSSTPSFANVSAVFKPVWPPIVGNIASGLSFSIIFAIDCHSIGSMYVLSAKVGSVIIVAGLELTKITLKPSFFRALQACAPE